MPLRDFSHPISHRTPHYWVGNGVIGWLATSQKPLNFWMKQNCKIQGNMGGNGLGNRCSAEALSGHRLSELISNLTSAGVSKNTCFKGHLETVLPSESTELQKKRRSRERNWDLIAFQGAEVRLRMLQIPGVFSR
jgi:hypothetical protein